MKNQTAVEWLEAEFDKYVAWYEGNHKAEEYTIEMLLEAFEKAKEMEKEQIENALVDGRTQYRDKEIVAAAQYYTNTYGGNQ
jgi:hypothetical protein